jgi:hypothetical protein
VDQEYPNILNLFDDTNALFNDDNIEVDKEINESSNSSEIIDS